jgi:hypothetical protein
MAALWATDWAPRSITCGVRSAAGIDLSTTLNYLQRTTSATAGNGLGTAINYLRRTTSAVGQRPCNTIKYVRR